MSEDHEGQRRRSEQLHMTRIMLRPTGNPLPLAFMALAIATVGFSSLQLGVIGAGEESVVALAVLVLTVPLQLFSSVYGFGARDPIAGTGMALVSGVWAMIAVNTLTSQPGSSSPALGVLLVTASVAILVPTSAARGKLLAAAVLAGSSIRFGVTGVAEITGSAGWETAAGALAGGARDAGPVRGVRLRARRGRPSGAASRPTPRRWGQAVARRPGRTGEGIAREAGVRHQL